MSEFFIYMKQLLDSSEEIIYQIQRDPNEEMYPELVIKRGEYICAITVFLEIRTNLKGVNESDFDGVDKKQYEIILTRLIEMSDVHSWSALMMEFFNDEDLFVDWGGLEGDIPKKRVKWYNNSDHPFFLFYSDELSTYRLYIGNPLLGRFKRAIFINISKEKADVIYNAASKTLSNRVRRAKRDLLEYNKYIQKES